MSELYELEQIADREDSPSKKEADPGYLLKLGYLPREIYCKTLKYFHVSEITPEDDIIPSPVDAVEKTTGKVLCAGTIVIVDVAFDPPQVVKVVGTFLESGSRISYYPKPVL